MKVNHLHLMVPDVPAASVFFEKYFELRKRTHAYSFYVKAPGNFLVGGPANSYALQLHQKAQGEATAFDKVYGQYKLAPEVTRRRMYYETMEQVLSKVDKTIVEAPGVTPYLPLPQVQKSQPSEEKQQ